MVIFVPVVFRFQSTCSVRSKTQRPFEVPQMCSISIHLLRAEQDTSVHLKFLKCVLFQSTCSVRSKTIPAFIRIGRVPFQSTCSVRSKTNHLHKIAKTLSFQSTCSVRSKTRGFPQAVAFQCHFNPLAPCGARQQTVIKTVCKGHSYCTDHLLISPTKGTSSRKKNHSDGKTAYIWCEPIRDLV